MTPDDLRTECDREGLLLHQCSEHHFQIIDETGPLIDCWPSTSKYRWHGAAANCSAKRGSSREAVKQALFTQKKRGQVPQTFGQHIDEPEKLPPRFRAKSNGNTVDHPSHYTAGSMEVIDAIEGLELGFHAGNVLKYVARYKHKGGIEDLKKARWYLDRLIQSEVKEPAF